MKRTILLLALASTAACSSGSSSSLPRDAQADGTQGDTSSTPPADTSVDPDVAVEDSSVAPDGGGPVDTGSVSTDAAPKTVTIKALQDPSDANHPTLNAKVIVDEAGLVALTGRVLVSSNTAVDCRFAAWVGKPNGGDFSAIQVQEVFPRGSATGCFAAPVQKIPSDLAVGQPITSMDGNYTEFCTAGMVMPCRDFEQSQIFLGSAGKLVRGSGTSNVPTPQSVTVADLSKDPNSGPGPRALGLEGTLVKVSNVRVIQMAQDGGAFTDTFVADVSDTSGQKPIEVEIRNFTTTNCVRAHFVTMNGRTVPSITGILAPDLGKWTIRLRDEKDVGGLVCGDAGV